jgi:hypothetical protein
MAAGGRNRRFLKSALDEWIAKGGACDDNPVILLRLRLS